MNAELEALLARLNNPALPAIDLSLDRMRRLMSALGNPEARLPPVVHIAGTNGKGSLVAFLQAICEAAGLRVHRYISPHLVRFNERIVLAGREIDDDTLGGYLRAVQAPALPATAFEAITAAAFLAFAAQPADVLLLEVGLGGRLDATNIIPSPMLTAITPISMDHEAYLGNTLETIAAEKAGIIKHGVPCVVGPQKPEAAAIIARAADAAHAPLFRYGHEWRVEGDTYISARNRIKIQPSLPGPHQILNAATAIACAESIPWGGISSEAMQRGVASARWPARLQKLDPYLLCAGSELWLDGGHNPAAGEALAAWVKAQPSLPLYLICGMVKGKDTAGFLRPLAPLTQALWAVGIPDEPTSQTADEIATAARSLGISTQIAAGVEAAFSQAERPCRVLICGSLYLAGKVLSSMPILKE